MYLAIRERISYTPSVEHIVDWMMLKMLPFCSKNSGPIFWLCHDHTKKDTRLSPGTHVRIPEKPGNEVKYVVCIPVWVMYRSGRGILHNNVQQWIYYCWHVITYRIVVVISWSLKFYNQLYWPARVTQSDQYIPQRERKKNGRQGRFHVSCTVVALTWAVW